MDRDLKKALADRLYDKRKLAALDLEQLVRDCLAAGDRDRIQLIITELCRDFAYAVRHPNYRNGGLIGLAAMAIALGPVELALYLDDIVQPILSCFGDADHRVRYYACESLYNVAKVAKGELLQYFNEIFDVLCRLVADPEESVRNGADLVDRLVKDIVAEKAASYTFLVNRSANAPPALAESADGMTPAVQISPEQTANSFSLANFIPVLQERIYVINPSTRMFLVQWIMLLDSIPDLELIVYLPEFLSGLLSFLSDSNREVRVATKNALDMFLREIKAISKLQATNDRITDVSKPDSSKPDANPEADVKADSNAIISKADAETEPKGEASDSAAPYTVGKDTVLDYTRLVNILLDNLDAGHEETRCVVLAWLEVFLTVAPNQLADNISRLVSVLLPTLSEEHAEIREAAERLNSNLLRHVDDKSMAIAYAPAVSALTLQFLNEAEITRVAALEWLSTLHQVSGAELTDSTQATLLKLLGDPSDEVVNKDLQLLAQVLAAMDDASFQEFIRKLFAYFEVHPKLLEARGKLVSSRFCQHLPPERFYRTIADILGPHENPEFVWLMVQNLNNNLLLAPELAPLRKQLRDLSSPEGASLFVALFKAWCRNAIAAVSLCLLAQAYEHAFDVLQQLATSDLSVATLVQIDRLVQLIESPVFAPLRLQLLEPTSYPYLYKCLYGLLMLLPQSTAFKTLQARLQSVSAIGTLPLPKAPAAPRSGKPSIDWKDLLEHFKNVQL